MKTKRQGPSTGRTVKKQPPISRAKARPAEGRRAKPRAPVSPSKRRAAKQLLLASPAKRRKVRRQAPLPATEQGQGQKLPAKFKSADATRDSTPQTIDSKLERVAGTADPARVAGGGRFHS